LNKHLSLFDNKLNWLLTLTNLVKDESLVRFIVNLDQTYQGIESYLDLSEMPGSLITNVLVSTHDAHAKFQRKCVINAFNEMPFFKISVLAKIDDESEYIWNPTEESLKQFGLRHTDKEVIYFEDEQYKETIHFFQEQLSKLSPDG